MPRWQSIINGELPGWDSLDEEEGDSDDGDEDDRDRAVGTQHLESTRGKDARREASMRSHGGYSSAGDDDGPSEG